MEKMDKWTVAVAYVYLRTYGTEPGSLFGDVLFFGDFNAPRCAFSCSVSIHSMHWPVDTSLVNARAGLADNDAQLYYVAGDVLFLLIDSVLITNSLSITH